MSFTNFPHGITSFGVPVLPKANSDARTGNVIWVDSGAGSDSNDDASFDKPLATLDHAIGHCTANNGDTIYIKEGHAETYSAKASLVCDVAGVTIIGLGVGDDRPTFTLGTAVAVDIDITAASVEMYNLHFKTALDNLTAPIHVTGANFTIGWCEFEDPDDYEANIWILTEATADDIQILNCFHNGYTAGNQTESLIRLVGANNALIKGCTFKGGYATAVIEFHTTTCTSVFIDHCYFHTFNGANSVITDLSRNVVATAGSSTYLISDCYDLGAGARFYGGSGLTVEKDIAATYASSASDMVIAASDLTYAASLLETYSSDLALATATIDTVASDTVVQLSIVKTVASNLLINKSHVDAVSSNLLITKSNVEAILSTQLVDHSHLTIEHSNVKTIGSNLLIAKSNIEAILSTQLVDHSHLTIEHSNVKTIGSNLLITKSNVEAILSTQLVDHSHLIIDHSHLEIINSNVKTNGSHLLITKSLVQTINSDMKVDMPRTITIASDIVIVNSHVNSVLSDVIIIQSVVNTIASNVLVDHSHSEIINSNVKTIGSHLLIDHSHLLIMHSHLLIDHSHLLVDHVALATVASHVVLLDTLLDKVYSHIILLSH